MPAGLTWLGWVFDQLVVHANERAVQLALGGLQQLVEGLLNPWLRQRAGLAITHVELVDTSPQSRQLTLKIQLQKID